MVVYKITNMINNKVYIGQTTVDVQRRWSNHKCQSKSNHCFLLKKAIKKYGEENFKVETIYKASTIEELNKAECNFISLYNSNKVGYNIHEGGRNRKMAESTKRKLSEGRKGKKLSLEHRKKLSEAHKGKKIPYEIRKKMSIIRKKKVEEGFNIDMSFLHKPIVQLSLDGVFIRRFSSSNEAFMSLGKKVTGNISEVLNGNRKNAFNSLWLFEKDYKAGNYKHRLIKLYNVGQFDMKGNKMGEYKNVKEASLASGVNPRYIRRVLNKKRSSSRGYVWRYLERVN